MNQDRVSSADQVYNAGTGEQHTGNFDDVYKQYADRILRVAYRFTQNEEVSRDLTQDVFIKVYQRMVEFRNEAQLYTWIHRIAVNHVLNYLRRERRNKWYDIMDQKISSLVHNESVTQNQNDTHSMTPHQSLEKSEREQIIQKAIDSLAPKYRVPFVLFRFEEMSYQQIADSMSLSLSAVEARIHRAKKQLIKTLEPMLEHI